MSSTQHVEHRYPDGSVYNGYVDRDGQRQGFGILILGDGARFRGHFKQGLFSGLGVITFPDGSKYEGEFLQGMFHGSGTFYRHNGMCFEGEFKDGSMHGAGLVTFPGGGHGLPRNEGYFEKERLVRREKCGRSILKARDRSRKARELCN